MKLLRLSRRLRFTLFWPVLAAAGVTVALAWFLPRNLTGLLVLAAATALALLASISWWSNRRFFRTLEKLTAGAEQMASGDLASRVAVPQAAELGAMARALNRLAAELEERTRRLDIERDELRESAARDLTETLRLAEMRRDLVANVSHELKTPLTAIRGYAETLEDGALQDPEVAPRFVRRILEQCERLETLLRDLLTLSRLETVVPRDDGEAESLDLSRLARQAVEVLTPRARERNVELRLAVEGVAAFRAPRDEIENLLLNLIENAIKYNRDGGEVTIGIRAAGREVLIEVADTGIGIPQDALDRVFERFYRVDKGRSREQGGTGLGLSIVKHAVRVLGGRIEVESRLGEGSTFRVWLPRV